MADSCEWIGSGCTGAVGRYDPWGGSPFPQGTTAWDRYFNCLGEEPECEEAVHFTCCTELAWYRRPFDCAILAPFETNSLSCPEYCNATAIAQHSACDVRFTGSYESTGGPVTYKMVVPGGSALATLSRASSDDARTYGCRACAICDAHIFRRLL